MFIVDVIAAIIIAFLFLLVLSHVLVSQPRANNELFSSLNDAFLVAEKSDLFINVSKQNASEGNSQLKNFFELVLPHNIAFDLNYSIYKKNLQFVLNRSYNASSGELNNSVAAISHTIFIPPDEYGLAILRGAYK